VRAFLTRVLAMKASRTEDIWVPWRPTSVIDSTAGSDRPPALKVPLPVQNIIGQHAAVARRDDVLIERLRRWLVKGLDDYIGLWQLIRVVGDERSVPWVQRSRDPELRDEVVEIVHDMFASGWFDWCGYEFKIEHIDADEASRRVRARWGTENFDHAMWFALTAKGRAVATTLA
jgi:hypothetical protein